MIAPTAGIIVRETSIPPRAGATAANFEKSLAVNRWRKDNWAGRSGGTYHDTFSLVVATTGAGAPDSDVFGEPIRRQVR